MQKLPDVNTGEVIRRVPGISLETDTGEGRYINIRGLDADLNSTTFGGLRLPPTNSSSPSGAGRAVAFDSIPIGFVGAIKVTKSNLPEQDAEALGGTIDITPKTAPSAGRIGGRRAGRPCVDHRPRSGR
jgi:outer membrane receptor protein involved in Fe transport